MALACAAKVLESILRKSLRPSERLAPDAWADKHRMVVGDTPMPGRWRTSDVPYTREVLRAWADPKVSQIVCMWATQCAKTETELNCLMYTIDCEPYPTIWVMDSEDNVREFAEKRLIPNIRASHAAARHLSSRKWDTKLQSIAFDNMNLRMVGAGSPGKLSSKPAGRVIVDERDKAPESLRSRGRSEGDAIALAYKRMGAFGDEAKAIEVSSPTLEHVGIHREYLLSDQAAYWVPCPHCGKYQTLKFDTDGGGGLRWEGGIGRDLSELHLAEHMTRVQRNAWYECANRDCAAKITDADKHWMLTLGIWVRGGQEVQVSPQRTQRRKGKQGAGDEAEAAVVRYEAGGKRFEAQVVGDAPDTSVRGFQLSRLYSPFSSFGLIAAAWVKLRGDPDQDFINSVLGEPWRERGSRVDENRILEIASRQAEDAFRKVAEESEVFTKSEVPAGAYILLGSIDVQQNHVYIDVAGWGENEARFVIDFACVECPELPEGDIGDEQRMEDTWALVADWVMRYFPRRGTGEAQGVDWWVIDAKFRQAEVLAFCRRMGTHVIPVMGSASQMKPLAFLPVDETGSEAAKRGYAKHRRGGAQAPEGGVTGLEYMSINSTYWRDRVFGAMHRLPPERGAWRYPTDYDRAGGREHARQITAEERVPDKRRGRDVFVWKLRKGRKENHWFDCAVNMQALAEHVGMRELTKENAAPRMVAGKGSGIRDQASGRRAGGSGGVGVSVRVGLPGR